MKKLFLITIGVLALSCTKPKEPQVSVDTVNVEKSIDKPKKGVSLAPQPVIEADNDNKQGISTPDNGDKQGISVSDDNATQKQEDFNIGVYDPSLSNIFEGDVFEGIGETEEYYRNNRDFTVKNYDVIEQNYELVGIEGYNWAETDFLYAKMGVTHRASVESKDIDIEYYYWNTYGRLILLK